MTERPIAARLLPSAASLLLLATCSWAALPAGHSSQPRLIGPDDQSVASASGLSFAWLPPMGAQRHVLVVSERPFDARSWSHAPQGDAFRVLELAKPIATFQDLGLSPTAERRFYWAVGSAATPTGPMTFSETRSVRVIPKFGNRVSATPFLQVSPIGKAETAASGEPDRIHLTSGYSIDPRQGEPVLPVALREMSSPPNARRTMVVYYGTADPAAVHDHILESGGTVVAYLPDHAFLVRQKPEGRVTLDIPGAWIGNFQPGYKLSPTIDQAAPEARTFTVLAFPDGDLPDVANAARAAGGKVLVTSDNGINKILRVSLPGSAAQALAQHPDVAWIEPYVQPTAFNLNAEWVVQTNVPDNRRIWDMGIHGEGQVIHHSDSGIDVTHEMFSDPSVPITTFGSYPTHRKIIEYDRGSNDPGIAFGDQSSASYHGSHTSGTAAGYDLTAPLFGYDGMARNAKIWHSDLSGPALGTSLIPPADLNDLFRPSYTGNAGGAARISTNSWGSAVNGAYTVDSYNVDQFMWSHPDYLICFANGNSGAPNTVGSPATAKDCVSVGGTRNGPAQTSIYTSTSRGPAADNRRKPTVCAPAQSLTSANQGPSTYATLAGTSMASPCVAGMAALMRQYCTDGWYPTGTKVPANGFAPSAALLKAMVVNSGVNQVTGFNAPDNNIGFGRVCADSTLLFAGDQRRLLLVDMTQGIGHGQSIEYHVNVVNDSTPLEATLCWSDYPGNPAAVTQLVNNLNLTVTNGVSTYKGNVYSAGFSITGGSYDVLNVEEAVNIKFPTPGVWTVRVEGFNVPAGPQPFGLCITGGVGTNAGSLTLDRATYGSGSTVQLEVDDTNAPGSVSVTMTSPTEPGGETVTLPGSNGIYGGSLPLSPLQGSSGDGVLQVSNGDVITATYHDASPSADILQTATVSFYPPVITNVQAQSGGSGTMTVKWSTNTNSSSKVYYGTTTGLGSQTPVDPLAVLSHATTLTGLLSAQTYYFDVESQDLNGNLTRDDNGGQHYRFTTRPPGDLLLMFGGPSYDRAARYDAALNELGWFYDTWSGDLTDKPAVGNLASGMRSYDVVWYQPSIDWYPPVSDAARDSIDLYVNNGGRIAVLGHDLGWSNSDGGSPFFTTQRRAWVENTLHSFYQADPAGWTTLGGVASDPISGAYTVGIPYAEQRSGASGDEISVGPGASGSWLSGDGTPASCAVRWESGGPLGNPANATWGGHTSRLTAMFFEWSNIDPTQFTSSALRRDVLHKTLTWLMGRDKPMVTVTAPNGGESITAGTTNITWTETIDGASAASRTIEYSLDGGLSWTTLTTSAGPSPFVWNLSGVSNTSGGRVRIRITDDGSPALTGYDASDASFSLARPGGDLIGPAVVAGSVQTSPNPIVNTGTASLAATITDALAGGSNIAGAEWSAGPAPVAAGAGFAMSGAFSSPTVSVNATIPIGAFTTGEATVWVRGQDAGGNWGNARPLQVHVNGNPSVAVESYVPRDVELRQNAPNPVTQSTTLVFGLPSAAQVRLSIYDVTGRRMRRLIEDHMTAGLHSVRWDRTDDRGRLVHPGVYYSRMDVNGRTLQRKIVTLE